MPKSGYMKIDAFGYPMDSHGSFHYDDARWVDPTRRRTKQELPYGYDEFFIFGDRETVKVARHAVYSDRMSQWDYDKFWAAYEEHLKGCGGFPSAGQKSMSAFMSRYYDRPITVLALAEGCNISNGYPYWIIWFDDPELDKRLAADETRREAQLEDERQALRDAARIGAELAKDDQ